MAFEYAYCTDGDAIIAVKDYDLKSGVTPVIGDVVTLVNGEVDVVGVTSGLVTTTTNLGVSEGNNFEGLGVPAKVGKVRLYGDAVYRAPYGTVAAGGGFTAVAPTKALIGSLKAIGKATNEGFVVHSDNAAANKVVKITEINADKGEVYFQFVASALFTS